MLNQRVKIKKYTSTVNEYGESVPVLSGSTTRWAEVEDKGGNMFFGNQAMDWVYDITVRVRFYKSNDIDNKDIVEYKGSNYRILDIQRDDTGYVFFEKLKCKKIE